MPWLFAANATDKTVIYVFMHVFQIFFLLTRRSKCSSVGGSKSKESSRKNLHFVSISIDGNYCEINTSLMR
jgi:hypothetical protein